MRIFLFIIATFFIFHANINVLNYDGFLVTKTCYADNDSDSNDSDDGTGPSPDGDGTGPEPERGPAIESDPEPV